MARNDDPARVAQAVLRELLADKEQYPVLLTWRTAAEALSKSYEAPEAWRTFRTVDRALVLAVLDRVRQALELTNRELERTRKATEERRALDRVRKLACELDAAIKASPLPGDWAQALALTRGAEGWPDVPVAMGWHSLSDGHSALGYPLAVCDVLQWAVDAVDRFEAKQPPRAAQRRHPRTERIQVFVRHLAWQFAREFGEERHTTIAHIASAIFGTEGKPVTLDAKAVEGFLKTRPAAFTPRKPPRKLAT